MTFLRTFALVFSFVAVACFIFLQVLTRTAQLPWTAEPGYRDPRYDIDSILPDRLNLSLPHDDELPGFQRPPGQVATCTRWMYDNRDALADVGLLNITMPGTHDSAAFSLTNHIMPGSLPWPWIQVLDILAKAGMGYIVQWAKSQTADLATQLHHGVRFFDFRAGVKSSLLVHPSVNHASMKCFAGWNGSHWVSCHTAEGSEMSQLFQAIDGFLNSTTHEIVIAELTHIYNADDGQLAELTQLMNDTLGHHIAPCCRLDRPLKDFWEDGRRLVLVSNVPCESSELVRDSSSEGECPWWAADSITNTYANSDLVAVMWFYNKALLATYEVNSTSLFKMSWTLTPQITTLIHGFVSYPSTLLQLADSANVLLPDFFDAQLAEGRTEFPQILISDHFQSAYLVPMSTRINRLEPCLGTDPS